MNDTRRILSRGEYESVLLAVLRRAGMDDHQARRLIDFRLPLVGADVLTELNGRGLVVSLDDVRAWVYDFAGESVDVHDCVFDAENVQHIVDWCLYHGRGELTFTGVMLREHPADFDSLLRSIKAGEGCN